MTEHNLTRDELSDFIARATLELQDDGPGILAEVRHRWPQLSRGEIADAFGDAAEALRDYGAVINGQIYRPYFDDGRSLEDALTDPAWGVLSGRDPSYSASPPGDADDEPMPS